MSSDQTTEPTSHANKPIHRPANQTGSQSAGHIPPEGLAVGVDLGGTNIQAGVVDPAGTVIARGKVKTNADDGQDAVIDRLEALIREVCDEAGVDAGRVAALGVGVPGPTAPARGLLIEAVNLRWKEVPVAKILRDRIGPEVFIDNDVNVAVFGEARLGAGQTASNLMGCWVGTGIGAGLILDGKIFYGSHHTAGEFGHMMLMANNAPGTRSVEHNCSRTAIVNRLIYLIRAGRPSMVPDLVDGKFHKIKSRTLSEAYAKGDELVVELIDDAAERLGSAIAGVVTLLSLERVVVGGGLVEAIGDPFVKRVAKAFRHDVFPAGLREVGVVESALGDDAGLIGAGLIGLHRLGV